MKKWLAYLLMLVLMVTSVPMAASAASTDKSALKGNVVVIDPGHSEKGNKGKESVSPGSKTMKIKDPGGAVGVRNKTPEYKINMAIALKLKKRLESQGITVVMTKTKDSENPGNRERAEIGNSHHADLVIRIHADSVTNQEVHGSTMLVPASVGYAKPIAATSRKYGEVIQKALVGTAGMKNRGIVERKDLTGFNWSKVPVVLAEVGFLSNPQEDLKLNQASYQEKIAEGLEKGIVQILQ
ncbi:N-acetylmuramoyl-L-alanine amidase family protein [Paenibacillus dokdonensis]|uniref:N-acetylmuramoyl-L-alanine amidase family protein n=1 Tax=Paenibacillus dokdonensis TaxID=2567944 RepID=UPI0010A7D9D0|nr:N-acetylmuramoyl-L-alanine amidase [Paenibacillus dokdonensis]